jgi:hypothetical protein
MVLTATGKLYRGQDTPEWKFYTAASTSTRGFGFGLSGGGSRACCSAWGLLNSLNSANFLNTTYFPYMSSNSGGSWTLQSLLYSPNRQSGANPNPNSEPYRNVSEILGYSIPNTFITSDILNNVLGDSNSYLSGYGSTQMGPLSITKWWNDVHSYFAVPKGLGQHTGIFKPAKLTIMTFGGLEADIVTETGLTNTEYNGLEMISSRTTESFLPMPIAVGCQTYRQSAQGTKYYIYPMEFTTSCSGVFRDNNALPVKNNLGNVNYPDYQVTNVLYNTVKWNTNTSFPIVAAPLAKIPTFGNTDAKRSNLTPSSIMTVSSNAFRHVYTMNTTLNNRDGNGLPMIKPVSNTGVNLTYVDGALVDNVGLLPLVQRRLPHITVFISTDSPPPFAENYVPDWTNVKGLTALSRYFGVPYDAVGSDGTITEMMTIAGCFTGGGTSYGELDALWADLTFAYLTYGTAIASRRLALNPSPSCQDFHGLSGPLYDNYSPIVTWVIVMRPKDITVETANLRNAPWWFNVNNGLAFKSIYTSSFVRDMDVSTAYQKLAINAAWNFPYYSTVTKVTLNSQSANALKYYTAGLSDMYIVPRLQKDYSLNNFMVDPVARTVITQPFGQVENNVYPLKAEIITSIVPVPNGIMATDVLNVAYNPFTDSLMFVYSNYIGYVNRSITPARIVYLMAPDLVNFTCCCFTATGIVVGGEMTSVSRAWLGVFHSAKQNTNGVINYTYSGSMSTVTLPSNLIKITSLTNNLPMLVLGSTTETKVPMGVRCALTVQTADDNVVLLWTLQETIIDRSIFTVEGNRLPNILSGTMQKQLDKFLIMNNDVNVTWFQDTSGTLTNTVHGAVRRNNKTETFQISVDVKIFDVVYCPLLSSLCMFYEDAGTLWCRVASWDGVGTTIGSLAPALQPILGKFRCDTNDYEISAIFGVTKIHAGYLGSIFVVSIDGVLYRFDTVDVSVSGVEFAIMQMEPVADIPDGFNPTLFI